jgi:hypothetical protein
MAAELPEAGCDAERDRSTDERHEQQFEQTDDARVHASRYNRIPFNRRDPRLIGS